MAILVLVVLFRVVFFIVIICWRIDLGIFTVWFVIFVFWRRLILRSVSIFYFFIRIILVFFVKFGI